MNWLEEWLRQTPLGLVYSISSEPDIARKTAQYVVEEMPFIADVITSGPAGAVVKQIPRTFDLPDSLPDLLPDLLPDIPWWVWAGGAAALFLFLGGRRR